MIDYIIQEEGCAENVVSAGSPSEAVVKWAMESLQKETTRVLVSLWDPPQTEKVVLEFSVSKRIVKYPNGTYNVNITTRPKKP